MQVARFGDCLVCVAEGWCRGSGCSILSAWCDSSVVGWLALVGYPSLEVSPACAMT